MIIHVDEARCSGCGQCVMEAPEIFDQRDEDGVAVVLREPVTEQERAAVVSAQAACPADAITLGDNQV